MKNRILLVLAIMSLFVCIFAISISAAPMTTYGHLEVTLNDGTVKTAYYASERYESRAILNTLYEAPDNESATIDLSTVVKVDFTNAKAYYTDNNSNLVEQTVRHLFSSGNGYANVTEIILPETLTYIRERSLANWESLKSIYIPASVIAIQNQAFLNCTSLETVIFGDNINLSSISDSFQNCTALETITIPASVTSLNGTFNGCSGLTSVIFEEGSAFATVGEKAFYNCSSLESIDLPTTVTTIKNSAFEGCSSLKSVGDISNVTSIGGAAFRGTGLVSVTMPTGLETLGKAAFYNCKSLTHVYNLENTSVTWMGESFYGCSSLTYVRLPKGLVTFESGGDGTFRNCSSLTDVGEMPVTLEFIGKNSFAGSGLSGVLDFSKCTKLTTFQGGTFSSTKISKVILSPSITDLGDHTFTSCPNLEEIVGLEFINVPELKGNLIEGKNKVTELRLPISASDGMLEVGNLLWDRPSSAPITVYVANANVKFDGIYYKTSCKINIVYCGDDYDKFFENSPTAKANIGENIFPVGTEIDTTKHSLIYGNNLCVVFYDGEHAEGKIINQCQFGCGRNCGVVSLLENPQHELSNVTTFGSLGYFGESCVTESCSICETVTLNETVGAIFVDYGYAATEGDINGTFAMSQFYGINQEALEAYKTATGKTFEYGLVAAADSDPITNLENGTLDSKKVFVTNADSIALSCFGMRVCGITEEKSDAKIAFCAYIKDGDKLFYLDDGMTVTSVTMKSYNEIMAAIG